jgi:predicted negative regulator of RcsB-dependent stress response
MQTQDAPAEIIFKLWPWLEANKNRLIGAGVAILVVSGIFYFVSSQKAQKEVNAGQELTTIMMNASGNTNGTQVAAQLEQLADTYSGTRAGKRAQLQAAAVLFESGSYPDAQAQFQKYLDANSGDALAATAELGLASSFEAQNQLDQAVAAYQRVISVFPGSTSVQPAEFALGRIAEQQNKFTEAMDHYQKVVSLGFDSSLVQEARIRASELQVKIAAAASKAAALNMSTNAPSPALQSTPRPVVVQPAKP